MRKESAESLIEWDDEQLSAAGIDKKLLIKIVRHLANASRLMAGTGLHVYGASGSGILVHESIKTHSYEGKRQDPECIIASVGLGYDGGDF